MADVIKCLVCGENNLTDQEFCQYCQSRLVPLTGDLKGADAPIKPGQAPTKKNTAELEPILPQWLRDARDSARKSTEHELTPQEKHKQESFNASGFDLLAGLQNQKTTSDEEETPEWLAGLTGDSPKQKKDPSESSEVRWVELGGVNDFAPKETPETGSGAQPESSSSEKDELNDWFRDASGIQPQQPEQSPVAENPFITPPVSSDETPDWLRKMVADSQAQRENTRPLDAAEISAASDTPDWLRSLSTDDDAQANTADEESDAASAPIADEPDWLRALGGSPKSAGATADLSRSSPGAFEAAEGSSTGKLPEWMDSLPSAENDKPRQGTVPNWLKEETPATSAEAEIPVWLSSDLPAAETEQPASEDNPSFGDIPSWLKAAAPQSSIYADEQPAVESFDTPDWLKTSSDAQPTPAFAADEPPGSAPPAFTPDAQASYNMDALFTDMPDWLSKATENPNLLSQLPAAGTDSIAPGDLPSWVQAMRPVGSGELSDETLETRGALAGLQGVLPAVAGYAATSKPKAYSIKLNASEEQQTHASFLEQILAAETAPVPIASFTSLKGSRVLRWAITFILFAVLVPALFMRTQFFSMPVGIPAEIREAMRVAQSIPEGAPVLVAIDYEPARVGEMETAAAPIFKHLKNPNLIFIATNETGGLLAGRFISGPLAGLSAESGIQPLNLGYLPGGQMGIRAFGKNPPAAAPFDISLSPVWTSPQLQGITSLSQFAVLIIISDNANSTRAWIEQTSSTRGEIPVLVISSAQAAPMIQPYYDSRQVSGLVTGLYGGAVVDQTYGGTTARNYWDAYSLGMYLAMALILGGGLINLALGLRDRAAAREAK